MVTYLSKYFYIKEIHRNQENDVITGFTGYFTDRLHTMFLPPQKITREEAIAMINAGIILITKTRTGQRKDLRVVNIFESNYL